MHRHRQQSGGYQGEEESGGIVKGVKYLVMEDDLTLAGGHTCNILMM